MITHFDALVTLLGIMIGLLSSLALGIWRARGWVDRRTAAEQRLARAIEDLTSAQVTQHRENQARFASIEARLPAPGGRPGRPRAG